MTWVWEVTAVDGIQAGVDTAGQGSRLSEVMVWRGDKVMPERQGLRRTREGWRGWSTGQQGALPWTDCCLGNSAERLRKLPQCAPRLSVKHKALCP